MLYGETVRNRFRGWHHWTEFPVLLTPADQRRIIMEKYKLLFTVDIRITDKGIPLATLHFVRARTHTHIKYYYDQKISELRTYKHNKRKKLLRIVI